MKFVSVKHFESHIEDHIKTVDELADLVETYRLPMVVEDSVWQTRNGVINQYNQISEEGEFPGRIFVATPIIQVSSDQYTTNVVGFNVDEQRNIVF